MEQDKVIKPAKGSLRSASYPSITLEKAVNLVEKIYDKLGSAAFFNRDQIAEVLGQAPPTIFSQVSSCTQYGLLVMKSGEGYKTSELFQALHHPLNESERHASAIRAIQSPPLYKLLFDEFRDLAVPPHVGLSHLLVRKFSITDTARERATSIFLKNLEDLKLLRNDRRLAFETSSSDDDRSMVEASYEIVPPAKDIGGMQDQVYPLALPPAKQSGSVSISIPLKGQRTATLTLPSDFTKGEIARIAKFVDALKDDLE